MKSIKGDKVNKSVAESLNAIVKPHLVTMSQQYNVYANAILEMEEKIRALKQIMLSQDFLNNIRDVNISCVGAGAKENKNKKEKSHKKEKENTILSKIHIDTDIEAKSEDNIQESASVELDHIPTLSFFTPKQKNSLFWCLYIIVNSLSKYEYEKNYFTAEQEFKIKTIERIKKGENKQTLKEHKMSKNMIESGLMGTSGCSGISPKILYALSLFYNVNIFYVYKNTYYEMFSNANANTDISSKIHIIQFDHETNYYSVFTDTYTDTDADMNECKIKYIENIKKTCLELDNLDDVNKPLRPITTYSLTDLVNIAAKMNIQDSHTYDESTTNINKKVKSKTKTKNELYTEIMEKCL
jgi:hypothetical protein